MADDYSRAKTIVAQWLDKIGTDATDRSSILAGLDAVRAELPRRDDWRDVRAVLLGGTRNVTATVDFDSVSAHSLPDGVVVATIAPGWGTGWHQTLRNEAAYDVLSWLLHYAEQYVHRSQMLKIILPLALEGQVVTHPFGPIQGTTRYGPIFPFPGSAAALADALAHARSWSRLEDFDQNPDNPVIVGFSGDWATCNTLDPYIHQAAFQLLRGMKLSADSYTAEALLAYDCVMEVSKSFLMSRRLINGTATRAECTDALGMDLEWQHLAAWTSFLRNHFSAHAGSWRWWDLEEVIGDDLETVRELAVTALLEIARLEVSARQIEPTPALWSEWFWSHFELLWKSVWFDALTTFKGVE